MNVGDGPATECIVVHARSDWWRRACTRGVQRGRRTESEQSRGGEGVTRREQRRERAAGRARARMSGRLRLGRREVVVGLSEESEEMRSGDRAAGGARQEIRERAVESVQNRRGTCGTRAWR